MNTRFQVFGYRNFRSKADKPLTVVTVGCECSDQDNARGRFGMRMTDFFLPDEKVGTLEPGCIGMEFIPEYEINGFGKPRLSDFRLAAWK